MSVNKPVIGLRVWGIRVRRVRVTDLAMLLF